VRVDLRWAPKPVFARYFRALRGGPIFSGLLGNALGIAATFQGFLRPISERPPRAISSQMPLFLTLTTLATSATSDPTS
jgi:hypothetical protein